MKSTLNIAGIQRTLRVLEQFEAPNAAKIEVGYFTVDSKSYGIRVSKCYHNKPSCNLFYTIFLEVQFPSTSGLVWVAAGQFSALEPLSCVAYTPKIRIDRNWITYMASPKQDQYNAEVNITPIDNVRINKTFNVCGESTEEIMGDFEGQQFQYNLVCDDGDIMDEEYNAQCMTFVLDEFKLMYKGKAEITCVDLMPTHIVRTSGLFELPYDSIAMEIENYVQKQGQ